MSTWDGKPNDYDHAVRLIGTIRADTIEECARVADLYCDPDCEGSDRPALIAAAIRALKDKPQ